MIGTNFPIANMNNQRKETIIGKCRLLDLPVLVPQTKQSDVKILGLASLPSGRQPSHNLDLDTLAAVDYFVIPASGNREDLLSSLTALKQAHPSLKIMLADSSDNPMFPGLQIPSEVEAIVHVSKSQGQAARDLLMKQEGLLTGMQGGRAAFLTVSLVAELKNEAIVAVSLKNLNQEIVKNLQN